MFCPYQQTSPKVSSNEQGIHFPGKGWNWNVWGAVVVIWSRSCSINRDLISLYSYKTGNCTNLNCTRQHMKSTHAQSIIYGVKLWAEFPIWSWGCMIIVYFQINCYFPKCTVQFNRSGSMPGCRMWKVCSLSRIWSLRCKMCLCDRLSLSWTKRLRFKRKKFHQCVFVPIGSLSN
jgi:hypothetical protein